MKRLIVGLSGASGVIYGIRLLEVLKTIPDIETHLVVSKGAEVTLRLETQTSLVDLRALAHVVHEHGNLAAPIASGSFRVLGMVVIPCSMKSMAQIVQRTLPIFVPIESPFSAWAHGALMPSITFSLQPIRFLDESVGQLMRNFKCLIFIQAMLCDEPG